MAKYTKQPVEVWLNEVKYSFDADEYEETGIYMPSKDALIFVNFIKEVNAGSEENQTPPVHLKMMDNVFNKSKRCAILCHRGIGKLSSPNSLVFTPNGWVKMEDIHVGDSVINRYGIPKKIDYKTPLQNPDMYEVILKDGTRFEVGDDHNHIVWMYRKKGRERVLTTKELLTRPLYAETKNRKNSRDPKRQYTYSIPLVSPIQLPTKQLKIAPYTMGYGLANGYFPDGVISCHSDDVQEISKYIINEGYTHTGIKQKIGKTTCFALGSIVFKEYKNLKSRTKYIPKEYTLGSIEQRTGLLRGLMDGDGHIAKNGGCSYSSYSKSLAYDVRDLARSLGAISYVKETIRTDKTGEIEYKTIINIKINPFKLKRKADKWRPTKKTSRAIVAINPIPKTGGYCIHIDSDDHSYITDGFTVTHNTTLFAEYLFLFCAAFGYIPGFGKTNLILYVTDSIENGVKNLRRNVEHRYAESEYLQKLIPNRRLTLGTENQGSASLSEYDENPGGRKFTDIRLEFKNNQGHTTIIKGYGAKALSLDTKIIMADGSTKNVKDVNIGDYVSTPCRVQTKVIGKSEIFNRPMYKITLEDGRNLKVCEDHLNSVVLKLNPNNSAIYKDVVLTTKELLTVDLQHIRYRKRLKKSNYTSKENLLFIRNTEPVNFPFKRYKIDPYTLGLLLGDGSLKKDGSCILHCHRDDFDEYRKNISNDLGKPYLDKRNGTVISVAIKGISQYIRNLGINVHGDHKFIPANYLIGSMEQRIALLQGLMDTDGSIQKNGRMDFCSNSEKLVDGVSSLVRSLGGTSKKRKVKKAFRIEIWISINPFKLHRKAKRFTGTKIKSLVAVQSICRIEEQPSQCIKVEHESHEFLVNDYIRTHNTGVRGAKELGIRPTVAVLDDMVSDSDAESPTVISKIKNTVYKAVSKALSPQKQKMIWLGTPFNARDPLYEAVESGAWKVSVYPICEEFPCLKEDFKGSWPDRFTYEYVLDEYEEAQALGRPDDFNQELMLRIISDEEKVILDIDIQWYSLKKLKNNRNAFNYYITTDFATTENESADYSVISVWALNHKGFWFWVDGVCRKQLMNKNIEDLFRLVQKWNPDQVGIEISGQQGGFISIIQDMMIDKRIWFNIASDNRSNKKASPNAIPGIRPNTNKMVRFNLVVPWFKTKQMFFPKELKDGPEMQECVTELQLITKSGMKSKNDDFNDSISMLAALPTFRPAEHIEMEKNPENSVWEIEEDSDNSSGLDSYIV